MHSYILVRVALTRFTHQPQSHRREEVREKALFALCTVGIRGRIYEVNNPNTL